MSWRSTAPSRDLRAWGMRRGFAVFGVGDKVVHPIHGAGTVSRIEERTEDGQPTLYYIIPDVLASCELMVPVEIADEIGLRSAMSQTHTDDVFEAIRNGDDDGEEEPAEDELSDAKETICLARTLGRLLRRQRSGSISQAERRKMDRLKRLLIGELSLVTGHAETRISALIDSCVIAVSAKEPVAVKAKPAK
jgi:CarD family transcriptional regulator